MPNHAVVAVKPRTLAATVTAKIQIAAARVQIADALCSFKMCGIEVEPTSLPRINELRDSNGFRDHDFIDFIQNHF